jgi:hypothetical protein
MSLLYRLRYAWPLFLDWRDQRGLERTVHPWERS